VIFKNSGNPGTAEESLVLLHTLGNPLDFVLRKGSVKNLTMQVERSNGEMRRQRRSGGSLTIEKIKGVGVNGKTCGMTKMPTLPKGAVFPQGGIFLKLFPKISVEREHLSRRVLQSLRTRERCAVFPGIQKGLHPVHKTGDGLLQRSHIKKGETICRGRRGHRHNITSVRIRETLDY
jgi:hypothetical protein